jgi:hypothetical protein
MHRTELRRTSRGRGRGREGPCEASGEPRDGRSAEIELCPILGDAAPSCCRLAKHPEIAAESARCARAGPKLVQRWKHKNEGTPETHEQASRRNQGALASLYKNGSIDAEQLASAVEIAWLPSASPATSQCGPPASRHAST